LIGCAVRLSARSISAIGGVTDIGANPINGAVNIGVSAIGGVTDIGANPISGAGAIPIGGVTMLSASRRQMI